MLHNSQTINSCVGDDFSLFIKATAAVLVSQAEAIVHSLTNMATADSNGYLKLNYMLKINNRRTKHYTYSYIHVRTFTKTEPVSFKQSHCNGCTLGLGSHAKNLGFLPGKRLYGVSPCAHRYKVPR